MPEQSRKPRYLPDKGVSLFACLGFVSGFLDFVVTDLLGGAIMSDRYLASESGVRTASSITSRFLSWLSAQLCLCQLRRDHMAADAGMETGLSSRSEAPDQCQTAVTVRACPFTC